MYCIFSAFILTYFSKPMFSNTKTLPPPPRTLFETSCSSVWGQPLQQEVVLALLAHLGDDAHVRGTALTTLPALAHAHTHHMARCSIFLKVGLVLMQRGRPPATLLLRDRSGKQHRKYIIVHNSIIYDTPQGSIIYRASSKHSYPHGTIHFSF